MSAASFIPELLPEVGSTMSLVLFNSLLVALGVLAVAKLLKVLPIRSARMNQVLWVLVLLPGVLCFRIPIQIVAPPLASDTASHAAPEPSGPARSTTDIAESSEFIIAQPAPQPVPGSPVDSTTANLMASEADAPFELREFSESTAQQPIGNLVAKADEPLPEHQPNASRAFQMAPPMSDLPVDRAADTENSTEQRAAIFAQFRDAPQHETSTSGIKDSLVNAAFLIWIAGGLAVVLVSLLRLWAFRRTLNRDRVTLDEGDRERWSAEWNAACQALTIGRVPPLCFTSTLGPGLCPGIVHPRLVIPVSLWLELAEPQREAVLRHEAAHLARKDLWRSFLIRLLALPHWFNPCVWLAVRRFDEAAEWACDELSLPQDPQLKCDFATLLVGLAAGSAPQPVAFGQQLVRRHSLNERVRRLVNASPDSQDKRFSRMTLLAIPLLLVAASIVEVRLIAQSTPATATVDGVESAVTPVPANDQATKNAPALSDTEAPAEAKTSTDDSKPQPPETTVEKDETKATQTTAEEKRSPDPIPSLPGFEFSPWYELDENQLWQRIGWKIYPTHYPDDMDTFVTLMQSPRFKNEALSLYSRLVTSLGIDRLSELPNIEALSLAHGLSFTEKQLESIARLPNLRNLDLSRLDLTSVDFTPLAQATKLKVMRVQSTMLSHRSSKTIGELTSLEELYLSGVKFKHWDQDVIQTFPLRQLSDLSSLRVLQVCMGNAGDIHSLISHPELETLFLIQGFERRSLDDLDFETLSQIPKLRHVRLPGAPHPKQVEILRPLTRLRKLSFPEPDDGLDEITAEIRRHLPQVQMGKDYRPSLDDETTFAFRDVPLADAMVYISRMHQIPIFIHEPSLDDFGIQTDEPINVSLKGVTLQSGLENMLGELGLKAVVHRGGLTITTFDGDGLYREDYDLSEVLHGVEARDNLAAQLGRTLEKLITPEVWGKQFTRLPTKDSAEGEVETGIAEIRSIGTTLSVLAPARSHAEIDQIVRQVSHGEHSRLLDVELRQMIDRHLSKPPRGYKPNAALFVDLPLMDCMHYISRAYDCRIIVDVVGLEEAGMLVDEPVTRDFELTTLEDALDKVLTPLKLTWIYQDEVFKVVTPADDAARPTLVVHQLGEGLFAPSHPLDKEDWILRLRVICHAAGVENPRFEVWHNRLIVHAPWRDQYQLSRKLDELLYSPNRMRRRRGSAGKTD